MGCSGNQRIAGGGVLLPQGLSSTYSRGSNLFFESLLKLLLPFFVTAVRVFLMRSLAYRQATFTFITSLHYRFSMLWTTDRHQHRERWLPLPRELIQSYIADMDLDPDSLSQIDEALISARLT
jgi:hypothetical protein